MAVGFSVGRFWYEVGHGDFLHSFFSNISYHLEPQGWGSKYPYLMNHLYHDKVKFEDIPRVIEELNDIRQKFTKLNPTQAIWDIEDLSKQPPWGTQISESITSLENYFVTYSGENLFDILLLALNKVLSLHKNIGKLSDIKIESI